MISKTPIELEVPKKMKFTHTTVELSEDKKDFLRVSNKVCKMTS